jgi:MFS family permease
MNSQRADERSAGPDAASAETALPATVAGKAAPRGPRLGRQYGKLWTASTVSAVGDGMALTAAPLLASHLTSDPVSIAAVTTVLTGPYVLFGIPAGLLADRVDLRGAMARTDWMRTLVVGLLALGLALGAGNLPLLYVCFFLVGTGETFFRNASQILVPQLVPKDALVVANGRQQAAQISGNQFVGPMVGAAVFTAGAALPFGLDAATFLVSATLLTILRVPAADPAPVSVTAADSEAAARKRLGPEMLEGVTWLWRHRFLRSLSATSALMNLVLTGILAVLVVEAHTVLRLDDFGYGVLLASEALGAVVAAWISPVLTRRLGGERVLPLVAFAIAAGCAATWWLRSPFVAGATLALCACAAVTWNVVVVHLRQTLIPRHLQGRVNGAYRLVAWGAMPVGSTAAGLLAATEGPSAVFGASALVMLAAAIPLTFGARTHWFSRYGAEVR